MWFDRFRSSPVQEKTEHNPARGQQGLEYVEFKASVSFTSDGSRQDGQCLRVSDSGLLAAFEHQPELWTDGHLAMTVLDQPIRIPARVARVNGHDVGFSFLISKDEDQIFLAVLIDSVVNPPSDSNSSSAKPTPGPMSDEENALQGSDGILN